VLLLEDITFPIQLYGSILRIPVHFVKTVPLLFFLRDFE
jgi:hypothetical protein